MPSPTPTTLFRRPPVVQGTGVALREARVTLTAAQIKALRATPLTLVAAPGAGKRLEFVGAFLQLNAGTEVFTESSDNLAIRLTDGSGAIVSQTIESGGFIDVTEATKKITNALPKIDAAVVPSSYENAALVLHNTGDGEFGGNATGDATMVVRTLYRVWPTEL